MEIELKEISVRDLFEGYEDNREDGIYGYGGRLNIRPPYQREFIYGDKERDAVIESVNSSFPLNVMYWVEKNDGSFELLDGQQRTISICQYVAGDFSLGGLFFHNLQDDKKEEILNYKLMIYWCKGTDSEILDWFKIINIAGKKLTNQEFLNALYHGPWVTDAKRYFSRVGCPAHEVARDYMSGTPLRQDYLETVIKWINDGEVKEYMAKNQHETRAESLWLYFSEVIDWIEATFPNKRKKLMQGLPWGDFYNQHKDKVLDPADMEKEIARLVVDNDVTRKKGIYAYVLTGEERHLNIRAFEDGDKLAVYERQGRICANKKDCPKNGEKLRIEEMEADHIKPWSKGGKTEIGNCQMLCVSCNRIKSAT